MHVPIGFARVIKRNRSAVPVVKLNPCVPMVQSAEHWDRDDASDGLNRT